MISAEIQIRFADCDLAGHVHNAAYLHYFESARINFFVQQLGKDWDWMKEGLIIKKNTLEYHIPIRLEDKISVEVRTTHVGTKSFTLSYSVLSNDTLACYGESVVVCFDHTQGTTIPIPEHMRSAIEKHIA